MQPGDVKCLICATVANRGDKFCCLCCNNNLQADQADVDDQDSDAEELDEGDSDLEEPDEVLGVLIYS
nr:hypothetical protein CFP56_17213 [Quercus suber]